MQPQQPYYGPPAAPQPTQQPNYDFIVNPNQPVHNRSVGGPSSMIGRILVVGGGLIVLIIAFVIIKGLLSGGGNAAAMLGVVQDQQELIHLASGAAMQQTISTTNKNFAITTQLAITSEQTQLLTYLAAQHQKISMTQQSLKISSATDTELTNSLAASTYDQTFQQVLQSELTNYGSALKLAYKQTSGPKGRKLLTDEYKTASLLQQQLATPTD
jgi:hypothetical protein